MSVDLMALFGLKPETSAPLNCADTFVIAGFEASGACICTVGDSRTAAPKLVQRWGQSAADWKQDTFLIFAIGGWPSSDLEPRLAEFQNLRGKAARKAALYVFEPSFGGRHPRPSSDDVAAAGARARYRRRNVA
jgi:hypothetical protein